MDQLPSPIILPSSVASTVPDLVALALENEWDMVNEGVDAFKLLMARSQPT